MSKSKSTKNPPYKNTPRLSYRLLSADDEALYLGMYMDAELMRHVYHVPLTREKALVHFGKALALTQQGHFERRVTAIVERATKNVIGISSIHMLAGKKRTALVGSMLLAEHQAKGYGPEYSTALMNYAFKNRPVDKLFGEIGIGNTAMESMAAALGFVRTKKVTPATPERPEQSNWMLSRAKWKKLSAQWKKQSPKRRK